MIGLDIVSIERIEKILLKDRDRFLSRFLNDSELYLARNAQSTAGLWAAKEAASKALGCGIGEALSFHDMTISKTSQGAPFILLSTTASQRFGTEKIHISITHDGGFSAAVAFAMQPSSL